MYQIVAVTTQRDAILQRVRALLATVLDMMGVQGWVAADDKE
jgi:hypothetical protein